MQTVYILSGPAGVGKSTTARELVKTLYNSAHISGDDVSHMHVNGREKPWESKTELLLTWINILCLTKNFIANGIDVVIDYVAFPNDVTWLRDSLKDLDVNVVYVVLWTDKDTLYKRDLMRAPEQRMGERSLKLIDEFIESGLSKTHILDTSQNGPEALAQIVKTIISNDQYKLGD